MLGLDQHGECGHQRLGVITQQAASMNASPSVVTLAYDARPLQPQTRHCGPGVVVDNVLDRQPANFRLVGLAHRFPVPDRREIKMWRSVPRLDHVVFEISPLLLRDSNVYWGTNHLVPQMVRGPSVVTVHDLLLLNHLEDEGSAQFLARRLTSSVRRACKVVADSKTTADNLLATFPELKGKVEVALLGFDSPDVNAVSDVVKNHYSDKPYAVMLGCHRPRKNLGLALAAMDRVCATGRVVRLLITSHVHPYFQSLLRTAPNWVTHLGLISKQEIFALLRGAVALLFPSRYEGFGLPVLEAMAAGCPVLALDTPINREIGGDAAWLLADDPDVWAVAIQTLVGSRSRAEEMRKRGFRNLTRFSWDQTASIYSQIFREAAR